jgi:hypothetical protein
MHAYAIDGQTSVIDAFVQLSEFFKKMANVNLRNGGDNGAI